MSIKFSCLKLFSGFFHFDIWRKNTEVNGYPSFIYVIINKQEVWVRCAIGVLYIIQVWGMELLSRNYTLGTYYCQVSFGVIRAVVLTCVPNNIKLISVTECMIDLTNIQSV